MKINGRWIVQALAFIGCIFFFIKIWDKSKTLLIHFSEIELLVLAVYVLGFVVCFFLMAVTSYLKQKNNGTLKNSIPFFEKLLSKFGLA